MPMYSSGRIAVLILALVTMTCSPARAALFEPTAVGPAYAPWTTYSVIVSPDGAHVYTTNSERQIARYVWNGVSERLEYVGLEPSGDTNFDVSISPDGAHVYTAGTLGSLQRVTVLSRDGVTGALTNVQTINAVTSGGNVREIGFSADGAQVYAPQNSNLTVFERDLGTGLLSSLQTITEGVGGVTGLSGARAVVASADGDHVYVAAESSDSLLTFTRDPGTGLLAYVSTLAGPALDSPISVILSADGEYLYVANAAGHNVAVFSRDVGTGALTFVESHALASPFDLVLSPSEDFLYVGEANGGIAIYGRDAVTGELTFVVNEPVGEVRALAITADGANIFTDSGAVVAFARDAVTGMVSPLHVLPGVNLVREVVRSPDNSFLYVIDRSGIVTLSRDPGTEEMSVIGGVGDDIFGVQLNGTEAGVLTADGRHLYASGAATLAVLDRDAVSGALTALESHVDDEAGVDGLEDAKTLALSADEEHLYLAGESDDAIAVFDRDTASGLLTFVEAESLAAQGLAMPMSPAVSPDGLHLYVVAAGSNALAVYDRDPGTGSLTFVDAYVDGVGGVDHLDGIRSLVVSPDGLHVYVASLGDRALVVYSRDPGTGSLSFLEVTVGATAPPYTGFAWQLRLSDDGSLLFAGGVSVFRRHADGRVAWIHDLPSAGPNQKSTPRADGAVYSHTHSTPLLYEATFGCAELPAAGCRTGLKSKLLMRDQTPDLKDILKWTWVKGAGTTIAEIAPNGGNHYAFCLYDESGLDPILIHEAIMPADQDCTTDSQSPPNPCWVEKPKNVKYLDRLLTPDGIESIKLVPKIDPKSSIKLKGRGLSLELPEAPLNLPLRVQLQSKNGICFESEFLSAKKNELGNFKAVAP